MKTRRLNLVASDLILENPNPTAFSPCAPPSQARLTNLDKKNLLAPRLKPNLGAFIGRLQFRGLYEVIAFNMIQ